MVATSPSEAAQAENGVYDNEVSTQPRKFRVYKQRWLIMFVVVILNLSNAALWITYAPVATIVQEFYEKYDGEVNYFSVVYLLISMPFVFISTFLVNKMGLGPAIHTGAALNCAGSIIKAIGTAPFVGDTNTMFAVSLAGQCISAMAQSFLLFIPTKVSQMWFPEEQRTISTTIISMSNPLGIVLGEIVTPLIIKDPEDVPTNNYVWCGLAIACELCTLACVTKSKPPTPASLSSEKSDNKKEPYWPQLKAVFTCPPYIILLFLIGFGVAFLSAMATVTQQILCVVGYSTGFSGLVTGLLILVGFVGSAAFGMYVDKTKKFTPVCKMCYGAAALCGIAMLEFFLVPDVEAAILVFACLFGFFGVGGYPIGLELAVEATYPVEETISTAFIFLGGQVQGIVLIALIGVLQRDMKPQFSDVEVCSDGNDNIVPKDYSMSIVLIMCLLSVIVSVHILFFNTPYKRRDAELQSKNVMKSASYSSEMSTKVAGGVDNVKADNISIATKDSSKGTTLSTNSDSSSENDRRSPTGEPSTSTASSQRSVVLSSSTEANDVKAINNIVSNERF